MEDGAAEVFDAGDWGVVRLTVQAGGLDYMAGV